MTLHTESETRWPDSSSERDAGGRSVSARQARHGMITHAEPTTKIVATVGPATCNREMLVALKAAGMSVARLNGAHADLNWHKNAIELIRDVLPDVPILLDIPGSKVRTKTLAVEPDIAPGDAVVFTTETIGIADTRIPVTYAKLHREVSPGDTFFVDDGTLGFVVERITSFDILCRALNHGVLKSNKGINVPFANLSDEVVSKRDKELIAFATELEVDFLGISFVTSALHLQIVRALVGAKVPLLVAKVERQAALDNLDEDRRC